MQNLWHVHKKPIALRNEEILIDFPRKRAFQGSNTEEGRASGHPPSQSTTTSRQGHDAMLRSTILNRIKVPSLGTSGMKEWLHLRNPHQEDKAKIQSDPIKCMWMQQTFRSMASPIYQNKLIRSLRPPKAGDGEKPAFHKSHVQESEYRDTSLPSLSPRAKMRSTREAPRELMTLLTAESQTRMPSRITLHDKSERPHPEERQRPWVPAVRSEDVCSFSSYPLSGNESGRYSDRDHREDDVPFGRRLARGPESRIEFHDL